MSKLRFSILSVVSIVIAGQSAFTGCSSQKNSTIETTEISATPALNEVPVYVITWNGAPGSKLATVGVFLNNGEFRTAFHSTEMISGSGLFFGTNLKAFLNGSPVVWKTISSGKYTLNRSPAEDWVHLSVQPRFDTKGYPFDFQTPLPIGTRIFVVGFNAPKQSIGDDMNMTAAKQVRSGALIETPAEQRESGADLHGLVFAKMDPPGLRQGWSGSPVVAELDGKLVVVGTAIDVNAPRKFGSATEIDWDSQYYTIVNRNGPK